MSKQVTCLELGATCISIDLLFVVDAVNFIDNNLIETFNNSLDSVRITIFVVIVIEKKKNMSFTTNS